MRALLLAGAAALVCVTAADAQPAGIKVGVLSCHVAPGWGYVLGSSHDLRCVYHPERGNDDVYVGRISKLGVDVGYTVSAQIIWDVVAPTTDVGPGALAGDYAGATASATVLAGAGANALFGGFDRSVALQPVSLEGSSGFDIAAGVGTMSLRVAQPLPPPAQAMLSPPLTQRFVVFFGFNRASLTPEGRQIVADAAATAEHTGIAYIRIAGDTDTVGSESYNDSLSLKRAKAVKAEMVRDGIDPRTVQLSANGFHDLLVPTGPGVREPQNRRAVIDLGNVPVSELAPSLTRSDRAL